MFYNIILLLNLVKTLLQQWPSQTWIMVQTWQPKSCQKGLQLANNNGSDPMQKWQRANFFKKFQCRYSLFLCQLKNINEYMPLRKIWKIKDDMSFWWKLSSNAALSNWVLPGLRLSSQGGRFLWYNHLVMRPDMEQKSLLLSRHN